MTNTKQISDAIKGLPENARIEIRVGLQHLGTTSVPKITTADLKALVAENEALREQFIKRTSLLECVFCGQQSFEISPIDSRDGICWNEQKIYTIKPGKALAIADGGNDE